MIECIYSCFGQHQAKLRAVTVSSCRRDRPSHSAHSTFARNLGLVILALCFAPISAGQSINIGQSSYLTEPRSGDAAPPPLRARAEQLSNVAAQTNQWYSALLFSEKPEPIYAQPLTVRATSVGLEYALPRKQVVPTERRDTEIHYTHQNAALLTPTAFDTGVTQLAASSDWAIDIELGSALKTGRGGALAERMTATVAHGSPYVFVRLSVGDLKITLPESGERIEAAADARRLIVRTSVGTFAFFASAGTRWEQSDTKTWFARFPSGKSYLSASVLPDELPATLALLSKHAFAHLVDTKVQWSYDQSRSQVTALYRASTRIAEGPDHGPLLGLYPHHWHENSSVNDKLGPAYDTVRGKIRLLAAAEFSVQRRYSGFVPYWPAVAGGERRNELNDLMRSELRNARRMMLEIGNGAYWQGKGLHRISKLMEVFEQQGDLAARDQLLTIMKERIEEWFSGKNRKTYFAYDARVGTLLAYPEEYFSVQQLNDHHFHYGYWIRAMADIALRDPEWAADTRWGGMVKMMVADIANTKRGASDFPFIRNFDPYEGHSWASGIALGPHGNNQESSSEALNAWAALILWAEIRGDKALRDLGVYLYSTEAQAIRYYWFDVHGIVLAPEYKNVEVSMLFGGKYSHNTWWTDEPRQIKGINLLPVTSASVYLGRDPEYIQRSLSTLKGETEVYESRGRRANPPDIWQDIFAKYMALSDPQLALKQWNRWGAVELGDTRSHTLHWLLSLQEMGRPELSITANATFYSVFRKPDGQLTYLAFNPSSQPLIVQFSNGKVLTVAPGKLSKEN